MKTSRFEARVARVPATDRLRQAAHRSERSPRPVQVLALLLFLAVIPGTAFAQRSNRLNAGIEIGNAIDDNPFVSQGGLVSDAGRRFGWSLTAYPSIQMQSSTTRYNFTLDYTFGFDQYESTLDLRSESHRVNVGYQADLNARWKLRAGDSYTRSPDFSGFLALRGLTLTPHGLIHDFSPAAVRKEGSQNSVNLGFDWARSPRSSLSLDLRHSYREYEDVPALSSFLPSQHWYNARMEFRKKSSERTAWTAGYSLEQFDFRGFGEARNHDMHLGVEREVRPSFSVRFRAGPSYTEALPNRGTRSEVALKSYLGYNLDLGITRASPWTTVGLFYRRDNSRHSGIGSLSTADTLGLTLSRKLGRRLTARITAMGYDYRGQLDNPFDYRGLTSTLQFDVALSRHSALSLGGSFQSQESEYLTWDLDRRRMFATLRFFLSDLSREGNQ